MTVGTLITVVFLHNIQAQNMTYLHGVDLLLPFSISVRSDCICASSLVMLDFMALMVCVGRNLIN